MLKAQTVWTTHPTDRLKETLPREELYFQEKMITYDGDIKKKVIPQRDYPSMPPKEQRGYYRQKVWRFECPYTGKEFSGTENWYNFFTRKTQKAIKKFIKDPKNAVSTWSNVLPCKILRWGSRVTYPDGHSDYIAEDGLIPINLYAGRYADLEDISEEMKKRISLSLYKTSAEIGANHLPKPWKMFQSKFMKCTEVRYGAAKFNQVIFKGAYGGDEHLFTKREAANKIGEWFLNISYDPQYKFCREKQWKEFQQIHNE